jgi:hypothetical protein
VYSFLFNNRTLIKGFSILNRGWGYVDNIKFIENSSIYGINVKMRGPDVGEDDISFQLKVCG